MDHLHTFPDQGMPPILMETNVDSISPKNVYALGCVPVKWLNIILVILTVISNVSFSVTLPIYAGAMNKAGGDTFVVLFYVGMWFPIVFTVMTLCLKYGLDRSISLRPSGSVKIIALAGCLSALNGLLDVYASPPTRTPPYLQGVLSTMTIPYTVIGRYLILKKAIGIRRLVCTGLVMIGLFLTFEPQIWNLSENKVAGSNGVAKIIWPIIFGIGFLPGSISNILVEKEMKKEEAQSMAFITLMQVFQLVTIVSIFWTDFIPGFGEAGSIGEFTDRLRTGLACNFSSSVDCYGLAFKGWMFIGSYCLGNLFMFLLIRYGEGAVYAAVVQALVTPLATFFWSFFNDDKYFHWDPIFSVTTGFTIAGVAVILPSVIMYNYYSGKEEAHKHDDNRIHIPNA